MQNNNKNFKVKIKPLSVGKEKDKGDKMVSDSSFSNSFSSFFFK